MKIKNWILFISLFFLSILVSIVYLKITNQESDFAYYIALPITLLLIHSTTFYLIYKSDKEERRKENI
jgi:hypothetical protein